MIEDLGRQPHATTLARMHALHELVRRGDSAGRVLLVEHEPVYTAGRATPREDLLPDVVPVERGGRITFHGPGQIVVYPIVPLPRRDLRDWLRRLEAFGVGVCAEFGLVAEPSVDGTGVFVAGKKVASIGVAVRHWINLHGIAINVAMDPAVWQRIRPCGLSPETMSDLATVAGRDIDLDAVRRAIARRVFVLLDPGHPL